VNTIIIGDNESISTAVSELLVEERVCDFTFLKPSTLFSNGHKSAVYNAELILIDLSSTIRYSREFVKRVRIMQPTAPIIALHFYKDISLVREIIDAGATAYLLVNTSMTELRNALQEIRNGNTYISKEIS